MPLLLVNVGVNGFMVHPIIRLPSEFSHLQGKCWSSRVYPEFFPLTLTERVLNVGCGEAPQVVLYAGQFREMVGVDIQPRRLERAAELMQRLQIQNVQFIQANVEQIPVSAQSFEVVLAIDIIEHVQQPDVFLRAMFRILVPGGRMLITVPAMHDKFVDALSWVGCKIFRRPDHAHRTEWHPDDHQHEYPVKEWRRQLERAGFEWVTSRATTMFPPLHLYGIPRFWFTNEYVHTLDRCLARSSWLQNWGQTVMAHVQKPSHES